MNPAGNTLLRTRHQLLSRTPLISMKLPQFPLAEELAQEMQVTTPRPPNPPGEGQDPHCTLLKIRLLKSGFFHRHSYRGSGRGITYADGRTPSVGIGSSYNYRAATAQLCHCCVERLGVFSCHKLPMLLWASHVGQILKNI